MQETLLGLCVLLVKFLLRALTAPDGDGVYKVIGTQG